MTIDFAQIKANASRLTFLVYIFLLLIVLYSYGASVNSVTLRDFSEGDLIGRDFINFWQGGRSVWDSQVDALYSYDAYRDLLIGSFGEPLSNYSFSYPPHSMIFLALFGALPYPMALALWSVCGLLAVYKSTRTFVKTHFYILIILLSPACVIGLLGGQSGLFTAALFLGGMSQINKRPYLAGLLFGILTVKPQLGVLLVVALFAGQYWRVIFSAGLTTLTLICVSVLLWGVVPWQQFVTETLPYQAEIISRSFGMFDHMVHSPYKWIINLGGGTNIAWGVQGIFMIIGAISVFFTFRTSVQMPLKVAFLCVMTLLFSPYIAIYDMTILSVACVIYYESLTEDGYDLGSYAKLLVLLLLVTPFLGYLTSAAYDFPLTVILLSIFAFSLWRHIFKISHGKNIST